MKFINTLLFALVATALTFGSVGAADKARKINWEDLRPQMGLEAPKSLDLNGDGSLTDEELAKAPAPAFNENANAAVPEMNGKLVQIPAFIVPLDGSAEKLTELLLVPYFGACIHVPPPPPNQIIHVKPDGEGVDVGELDIYDPVYVTGVLETQTIDHELAQIGYKMKVQKIEAYTDQ